MARHDMFEVHRAANGGRGWVVWLVSSYGKYQSATRVRWHETKDAAEAHASRLADGKGLPWWSAETNQRADV